ncbi:MAG TPA: branched-chain amino acid ABC transporter permease [Nitrospirota bacterium]|nr:branched-chain amino acid ABC transporter permease [Nitrospirota bacterium]
MYPSPRLLAKYANIFIIPLWTGLLMLPFTGPGNALRISAAAAIAVVLWKLRQIDVIASLLRQFTGRFSRIGVAFSSLVSSFNTSVVLFIVVVALLIVPLFLNDYYRDVLTLTCIYIVLALGLNITVGQAGLLNLGYVAFYAVGAYTYAILSTTIGLSFWPGMIVGALSAAAFSLLLGLPTLKLRGDYFAIVTLGLGEITRIVLNNWDSLTGGPNGISRIGRPMIGRYVLTTTLDYYYLIFFIALVSVFAMHRLISSRIGRAWIAVREDEFAAEAMGINTFRLKLLAFVLGSAWAGMTGVFFAAKMAFVSPESFTFFESVMILCMVVLGGMGSIPGIILGALLLITLPEVFRDFQDYRMLAFGIALVLMMIFRPQGLLGTVKKQTQNSK